MGNLIGTQKNGRSALGNSREGVEISGTAGTTVGGMIPEAANTIAFNAEEGVPSTETSAPATAWLATRSSPTPAWV